MTLDCCNGGIETGVAVGMDVAVSKAVGVAVGTGVAVAVGTGAFAATGAATGNLAAADRRAMSDCRAEFADSDAPRKFSPSAATHHSARLSHPQIRAFAPSR